MSYTVMLILIYVNIILIKYDGQFSFSVRTLFLKSGSPPSSSNSWSVMRLPCLAATCTGVCPSSVARLGPAPDLSSIRAQRSPSFTLAAMWSGVSRNFPPGKYRPWNSVRTRNTQNFSSFQDNILYNRRNMFFSFVRI